MRIMMKRLASACAGALLLACADTPLRLEAQVAPGQDSGNAAERNRDATDLAEQGHYAAAIALWKELTANASGPGSAYLFRNLGYAHFLNQEYEAALAALEKACLLDPLNPRGWHHLGSALRKLGQEERAELMFRQAATLEQHEFGADYALARGTRVAAIADAVAAPQRPADDWASTGVLPADDAVVDLRPAQTSPVAQPATTVQPARPAAPPSAYPLASTEQGTPAKLEIRNGNGVRGMAAATARQLNSDTLRVVRLTNEKGFNVHRTRVEYERGYQEAASVLAQQFGAATVVEVKDCWKADMRLVIGRDLVRTSIAGRRDAKPAQPVRPLTST